MAIPVFSPELTLPGLDIGHIYTYTLSASGNPTSYTFSGDTGISTGQTQTVPAALGIDKSCVVTGGFVASDGRLWYAVNQAGSSNSFFAAIFERVLFSFQVNSAMMSAGSSLTLNFAVALQLLRANLRAQYLAVVEMGTIGGDAAPAITAINLSAVNWNTASPILAQQVILDEVAITHNFGVGISVDGTGTVFTAQQSLYGVVTGGRPAPASGNFALRARLIQFDTEDGISRPKGIVSWGLSNASASISRS